MDRHPKVAMVGIDGFSPMMMDDFVHKGYLPAIAALARGAQARVVPSLPATTPVSWASMMTGAPPSVTGIEGFLVHQPGDELDQRVSGCYSYRCRAQTLWEAAAEADKRAFVIKFPVSYPSSSATFRLDGAAGWGGLKCLHEAASRSTRTFRYRPGDGSRESSAANGCIPGTGPGEGKVLAAWSWPIPALWGHTPVELQVSPRDLPDGSMTVDISSAGERSALLTTLREGEWSQPLTTLANGRRGPVAVSFRVKVLECSRVPLTVRVANTALHERDGHSIPDALWQQYASVAGPIEEQTEPSMVMAGELDLTSQLELFDLNVDWLGRIATEVLREQDWDLFLIHLHVVDWAHHLLQGGIDPRHPDFDEGAAARYWDALLHAYRLADRLVADICSVAGDDADVVVVGDHGQDLVHSTFRINEWLADNRLLEWSDDEGSGVVWEHTRAYATGNYLYLNVAGREPHGVLDPAAAERLRDELIDGLIGFTDPVTGSRPVLIAGPKEHFENMGANGRGVGDIVFCLRSGYQEANGRGCQLGRTRLLRDFTSSHDHFWPLDPRIHTRLFGSGPHFRQGHASTRLAYITDIAPTLCSILGIDPPRSSIGRVLSELLIS